jgi:predicted O-linked N-acetylglucosamine transferase (SPINDLY family)
VEQTSIKQAFQQAMGLYHAGKLDEAQSLYGQILSQAPGHFGALHCSGLVCARQGRHDEAIGFLKRAAAAAPSVAEIQNDLGNALFAAGRTAEACAAYRAAIELKPRFHFAYFNLGVALQRDNQLDGAISAYQSTIEVEPGHIEAHNNLGAALQSQGRYEEAAASFRQVIALAPDRASAYANLGTVLRPLDLLDEAIEAFRRAVALQPDLAEAYFNLANALRESQQVDEAMSCYRKALSLRPDFARAHSNFLYALHFIPDFDADAIADEHRIWYRQHAEPLRRFIPVHQNDRRPDRQLRIGYVSPNFLTHVAGRFILPVFRHHDRGEFHITCYDDSPRPDAVTDEFKRLSDGWCRIAGMSDDQVAARIHADEIDILVDLTLHMADNRLLVFARKPAPVQVSFTGYPASTGLPAIDYRFSDPYLDPPGADDSRSCEQIVRLPATFWCFDPPDAVEFSPSPPAMDCGHVTFGCLNAFAKVNAATVRRWAQVMHAVAGSQFILLAPTASARRWAADRFGECGIGLERLEFVVYQARRAYFETYRRIDIALDTFPYNGHTTSLDCFWMGVPVVSLVGATAVSRAGWSQLSNLQLCELAASKPEEFTKIASELANDLPRLRGIRSGLRQRMEQSPLMDQARYARDIEQAYRGMWHRWASSPTRANAP